MTDEVLRDERLISGTGVLRIPPFIDQVYYWSIVIDVIRPPSRIFRSNKYSPARQRYATVSYLKDGYVLQEELVDYPRRRFDLILDPVSQALLAVKCAYEGTLISFANLATALNLVVISIDDLVKPMESLNLVPDTIHFRCEQDTALQVRLFSRQLITCDATNVRQPKPPPPPDPLPPVPPGESIGDISDPYDENDDITVPDPLDQIGGTPNPPIEFPVGDTCEQVQVTTSMTDTINGRVVRSDPFYGPVEYVRFRPSSDSGDGKETILIRSRGLAVFEGNVQPCLDPLEQILQQQQDDFYVSHEIISVEPIQ